jgi:hypothetical protein
MLGSASAAGAPFGRSSASCGARRAVGDRGECQRGALAPRAAPFLPQPAFTSQSAKRAAHGSTAAAGSRRAACRAQRAPPLTRPAPPANTRAMDPQRSAEAELVAPACSTSDATIDDTSKAAASGGKALKKAPQVCAGSRPLAARLPPTRWIPARSARGGPALHWGRCRRPHRLWRHVRADRAVVTIAARLTAPGAAAGRAGGARSARDGAAVRPLAGAGPGGPAGLPVRSQSTVTVRSSPTSPLHPSLPRRRR